MDSKSPVAKPRRQSGESFSDIARELGCDPDDPRVAEVLKAMAAQPPKPHEKPGRDKPPARNKKHSAAKAT